MGVPEVGLKQSGASPRAVEAPRAEIPGRPRAASQSSLGWKKNQFAPIFDNTSRLQY